MVLEKIWYSLSAWLDCVGGVIFLIRFPLDRGIVGNTFA